MKARLTRVANYKDDAFFRKSTFNLTVSLCHSPIYFVYQCIEKKRRYSYHVVSRVRLPLRNDTNQHNMPIKYKLGERKAQVFHCLIALTSLQEI